MNIIPRFRQKINYLFQKKKSVSMCLFGVPEFHKMKNKAACE